MMINSEKNITDLTVYCDGDKNLPIFSIRSNGCGAYNNDISVTLDPVTGIVTCNGDDINTKYHIQYKYEKEPEVKKVAQFKQNKFDQIKGRKNVAKPSKFFIKI